MNDIPQRLARIQRRHRASITEVPMSDATTPETDTTDEEADAVDTEEAEAEAAEEPEA